MVSINDHKVQLPKIELPVNENYAPFHPFMDEKPIKIFFIGTKYLFTDTLK
jgi:hypothetical protein